MRRKKGYFSISAVAKMLSVHQQTIRMYEKEGLISPKRSEGGTRLFREEDVDRLEEIIHLTHRMGVNLAGVEIILRLQRKMGKLQDEVNKLFGTLQGQLEDETEALKIDTRVQVKQLQSLKTSGAIESKPDEEKKDPDWEIDYDE